VLSFSPVVGIGTSPPPHPQASVSHPFGSGGGGGEYLREREWGAQFRRGDRHCCTLGICVLCGSKSKPVTKKRDKIIEPDVVMLQGSSPPTSCTWSERTGGRSSFSRPGRGKRSPHPATSYQQIPRTFPGRCSWPNYLQQLSESVFHRV
jgi:hypothetical protein